MNNLTNLYAWLYLALVLVQHSVKAWTFWHCFKCRFPKPIIYISFAFTGVTIVMPYALLGSDATFQPILIILTACVLGLFFAGSSYEKHKVICFWLIHIFVEAVTEILLFMPFSHFGLLNANEATDDFTFIRFLGSFVFTILYIPVNYFYYILWNKIANKSNIKL